MDIPAYIKECFDPIKKQFAKRGFTINDAEPVFQPLYLRSVAYQLGEYRLKSDILIQGLLVGRVRIEFQRSCRVRLTHKSVPNKHSQTTNGGSPTKNRLFIGILGFEKVQKSQYFTIAQNQTGQREVPIVTMTSSMVRGIPGLPVQALRDSSGNIMRGRPKVKRFAAFAVKQFQEKHLAHQTSEACEFIHDQ